MSAVLSDIVVVGNGATGLFVATALVQRSPEMSVTLVGPRNRAGGASSAAGAMLGCFGEVTRSTVTSLAARRRFDIQLAAHRRWRSLLEELESFSPEPLLTASDTYVVLNSRGGQLDSENFEAMLVALAEHEEPHEFVTSAPGLDPVPDARPLRTIRLPSEGAVHAGRLLAALEARAATDGVRLVDATVRRITCSGEVAIGVELSDGAVLPAGQIVIASGAFMTPLVEPLAPLGTVPPVLSGSGVAYVTERVLGTGFESAVRTVTRAGSCGLHLVPLGDGREYIGATNVIFAEPELRPHLGVCHFLSEAAIDQFDRMLSYSRIDQIRVGNRPVTFDTFPLLGEGPVTGTWIIGGGYRDALHAAPELAELAAQSIIEGKSMFPTEFAPCREPISTMSVESSIDEFVDQQVASAFEGGIRLTPFQGVGDLEQMYRPLAERLYDRLGISSGLAPDVVTYLCLTRKYDTDVDRAAKYLKASGTR